MGDGYSLGRRKVIKPEPLFGIGIPVGLVAEFYLNYRVYGRHSPCEHARKIKEEGKVKGYSFYNIPNAILVVSTNPNEHGVACLDCINKEVERYKLAAEKISVQSAIPTIHKNREPA